MTNHDAEHAEEAALATVESRRVWEAITDLQEKAHVHPDGPTPPADDWGFGAGAAPTRTISLSRDMDLGGGSYPLAGLHLIGNGYTMHNGTLITGPDHIVDDIVLDGIALTDAKDDLVDAKLGGLGIWRHVTLGGAPDEAFVCWHHQGDTWAPSLLTFEDVLFLNVKAEASTQQSNHALLIGSGPPGFRRQNASRISMRRSVFALEKSNGRHLDRHPVVGDGAWFHGQNNVSMDWNGDCITVKRGARVRIEQHYWNPECREDTRLRFDNDAGPLLTQSEIPYWTPPATMTDSLRDALLATAGASTSR